MAQIGIGKWVLLCLEAGLGRTNCASARLEEKRSGTQHGAELAIMHYTCMLHRIQLGGRGSCGQPTIAKVVKNSPYTV